MAPSRTALAEEPDGHRLSWEPQWRPFQLGDAIWTLGILGAYVYLEAGGPGRDTPRFSGRNAVDEWFRDALRGDEQATRDTAAVVSDVAWWSSVVGGLSTSLVVPLVDDANWRVAWELTAMNAELVLVAHGSL